MMKFNIIFVLALIYFTFLCSCEDTRTVSFDLKNLPSDWVQLTKKNGKFVVYNSCDSGNLLMTISKNENKFKLLLHGEQEDSEFEILKSFKLGDTIFLNTKSIDSGEAQKFSIFWLEKQKNTARWITKYPTGYISDNIFVSKEKQTNFERIDQPCKECWGEECDDI